MRVSSRRPLSSSLSRFSSVTAMSAAMLMACSAKAQVAWQGDSGATPGDGVTWTDALNWGGDIVPPGTADLIFGSGQTTLPISLNGIQTAKSLTFNVAFTLGAPFSFDQLTLTSGAVTVNPGITAQIAATLDGSNGLTLGGGGTLALSGSNIFTGPVSITGVGAGGIGSSGLSFSADTQLGGTTAINLQNGGGITYTGTSQIILGSTRAFTIGTDGGFISIPNASPTVTTSKLSLSGVGQISGSGTLTKTGAGLLTITAANPTFTGNWKVDAGVLEVTTGTLNGRPVTINGVGSPTQTSSTVGELAVNADTAESITLAGGILSANNGNRNITGSVTVSAPSGIRLNDFYTNAAANIRTLTISGALTGAGDLTTFMGAGPGVAGTAPTGGTLSLTGNNSAYSGKITINSGTTVQARGTASLSGNESIALNGGTLSLLSDGDGTQTPETINFTDPIAVTANSTILVGRQGNSLAPLFTTAGNKTIRQNGVLTIGAQTLTVTNNNGYGLDFSGTTTLTATPTFNVANATASNLVPGLTFSGKLTGTAAINKAGAGTLALGNTGNDFVGNVNVTQGVLSISDNAQLGAAANQIVLSPTTGTSTLRATDNVTLTRTIQLGTAANTRSIEVVAGKTLTLTSPLDVSAAPTAALVKNDNGTLALTVANPATWTGGVTINAGAVLVSNAGAFGAPTAPITISPSAAVVGAALQLTGGISLPNPVNLQGVNNIASGGLNFGGHVQSVSGINSTAGQLRMDFDAALGADAGATLNINGGINNTTTSARALIFTGAGTINLNSSATAATATANQYYSINKYGTGTLNITTANPIVFANNFTVFDGTLSLNGAGTLTGGNTIAATVNPGATLTLDNSSSIVANRLGGRPVALFHSNFNYIGGATASTETDGALSVNRGHSVITATAGAGGATLTFGATTRAGGGTALFRGTGLGSLAGAGVATINSTGNGFAFVGATGAAGTPNKGILPWALIDTTATGSGVSFATADTATGIIRPLAASEFSTTLTAGNNVSLNTAATPAASISVNSLTMDTGGSVTNAPGNTLTVGSGGILALSGNTSITGGLLTQGTGELIFHTLGNLDIGSTIVGGSGGTAFALTKSGAGTLTLNTPSRHAGQTIVNQGALSLNGGNNTIALQNYLVVSKGATLNLNGNTQIVTDLFSDATVINGAGTVTGTAGSMIVLNRDNGARNWAGTIAGETTFVRGGQNTLSLYSNNTYSGATILTGGVTTLVDAGALSNTSRIDLNYGTLRVDNAASRAIDSGNRVNDAAPITMRGGTLILGGHPQAATRENFGALTLAQGTSELNMTRDTNGVSSVEMSFASLNQTNNATTNFQQATGALGSAARIYFGNGTSLVKNNILPAWIVKGGGDWAGYNSTMGVGSLGDAGYAGYDGTAFPAVAAGVNQNINLGASGTVAAGGQTLNTLNIKNAYSVSFVNDTDVLNLGAGGLMKTGTAATFGATVGNGQLTAGGTNPTGTVPLYIHTQTNGWTMNSQIVNNPTNNAPVRLVYVTYNGGNMTLAGNNTYTGGSVFEGWGGGTAGTLTLGSTGVIPAGGITISNVNFVQQAGGVIDPSNVITITGATSTTSGAITLAGNNTLAGLVFDNNGGTVSPTVTTGGVLTLTGGITATSSNPGSTPVISGTLDLGGGTRTIDVAPITIESKSVAPYQPVLNIAATIQNGGITKTNTGVLGLSGVSTYSGPTNVNQGTLQFIAANAGVTNSTVNIAAGAALNLGGFNGVVGGLSGTGDVINATGGVPLTALSTLTVGPSGANSSFAGLVSGAIALNKTGTGTFQLANTTNSFTGGITVNGGTLLLPGAGLATSGTGLISVNNSGSISNAGSVPGGLAFNTGSAASLALGATAPVTVGTAGLSTSGLSTINVTGTPAVGTYSLIDYAGTALTPAQFAAFKLGTNPGGGFVYGLVNNTANTSVDVTVEAAGAANTWTGTSSGIWDPSTPANWASAYADGQQVTFNDSGVNKTITGFAVSPQAITVSNSANNNYSIANSITGTLAGGLTKNGTGTLQLTGANTFAGPIAVNGGTLRASVASGASGLGTGSIALNSTTLQLDPTASANAGLTGRLINGATTSNIVAQRDFNQTALDTRTYFSTGTFSMAAGNTAAFYAGGPADNFSMQWTGKLNISNAGAYSFFTASDDGSRVFIDGVLVAENDGSHGTAGGDVGGAPIFLSLGYHDVRVEMTEGTGGNEEQFKWQGPGIAKATVPSSALLTAENSSNAGSSNNIALGNNVSVSGSSTINLNGTNFTGVQLGTISQANGSVLNVTGLTGKQLRASSTTFAGGTATIDSTPDVAPGQLIDNGTAVTLVKKGSGRLILDSTATGGRASSMLSTSTIDVQNGKLVLIGAIAGNANGATNPAGAAKIQLNGGSLVLDQKGSTAVGNGTTTFDNAVVTTGNSLIEVVPVGGITGGVQIPIALGSATNGISLATGSTLTIDVYGGARSATALGNGFIGNTVVANGANLVVNGVISGNAGLSVQSSQFNGGNMPVSGNIAMTAANTFSGPLALNGRIYNAPNVLGGGLVSAAAANGAPLTLTLSGNGSILNTSGITFNTARLTLDYAGTNLAAAGGRIGDTMPVALNNSVLQFLGNTTAASGETFGTLTANGGFNAVSMSGVLSTAANTLTATNLTRANNAQIAFQGSSLGTVATNSNLLKLGVAPSSTLTDGIQLVGGGATVGTSSKTVSILPFAVGTTNTSGAITWRFVGYDATNGIRPLDPTTEFEAMSGTTASANARDAFTTAPTVTGRAVNSWILDDTSTSGGPHAVTLNGTATLASGALLLTSSSATPQALSLTGGTVAFGTAEGVITTMSTAGSTISSTLTGTNGLTVGGTGQTALAADNSAGLTGTVTVNGQLAIAADTALGNASNPLNLNGGILKLTAATTLAATRTTTLLANTTSGIDTTTGNSVIAGVVTGAGNLAKISGNTLTLSNIGNNYTGRTEVYAGALITNSGPSGDYTNNGAITFDQSSDGAYSGNITGYGTFTKSGTGIVTMNGAINSSGATTINGGALLVNGSISGSVAVNSGATLGGRGVLNAPVAVNSGATLAPGTGIGNLTANSSTAFATGSVFALDLNGNAPGVSYDQLTIGQGGSLSIAGGSTISLTLSYLATLGQVFTLVDDFSGPINGAFSNLADDSTIDAAFAGGIWSFKADYQGGDGNDLTLTVIAVPEPGSAAALLAGCGMLAGARFRRRKIS